METQRLRTGRGGGAETKVGGQRDRGAEDGRPRGMAGRGGGDGCNRLLHPPVTRAAFEPFCYALAPPCQQALHHRTIPETPSASPLQIAQPMVQGGAQAEHLRRALGPGRMIDNSPSKRAPKSSRTAGGEDEQAAGWFVVL